MVKIIKIKVSTGIFFVEIPGAGLRILCGCPADSVKHLMKRGLILPKEERGVSSETGPNAILLSDLLLQNGSFSNLSEFPVLQMLYRQGMKIPNHPNNTGQKPVLIGDEQQVKAQMAYIHRGNYGLSSKKELTDAGVPSKAANGMMQLKLKFAFGSLTPAEELLDGCIVAKGSVEIRNEVFIRRLRLNLFELEYQGETVTIDLNLKAEESYEPPYPLGFYQIPREYFAVVHSGEGDGWDINRPCMGSILVFQGKIYLIDAGPHILESLLALGIGVNEIEGIFHTHLHDDHFAGLPTLLRSDKHIKYYTTPLVRTSVFKKLAALLGTEETVFYDYFDVHDLEMDQWNNIEGLEVQPLFSPHPVETNIFIFRTLWEDGYCSYAHFADIVSMRVLEGMVKKPGERTGVNRSFFEKIQKTYLAPATLKKLDIGGGMIHGTPEDFQNDPSDKIILSHTSKALTSREKMIGSGAPFGTADVLIPSTQEYLWRYAFQFLTSYFPDIPKHELGILLNNPIETFNPESTIIKGGKEHDNIYLLLSGNVEMLQMDTGARSILSAGALVGEISGLIGIEALETYRAASFVSAMRIKRKLYVEFVRHNHLYGKIEQLQDKREFMQRCSLFSEALSYPTQNKIASAMQFESYPSGHVFQMLEGIDLFLVKNGTMQIFLDSRVFETLSSGSFFGESNVLYGNPAIYQLQTLEPVDLLRIPGGLLMESSVIHWKLLESYERRMQFVMSDSDDVESLFEWKESYSVGIDSMDDDHKSLFKLGDDLFAAMDSPQDDERTREIIKKALASLVDYTEYHFRAEEKLLRHHDYPELQTQKKEHRAFINRVKNCQEEFLGGYGEINIDFLDFFKDWFVKHILAEDQKYAAILAEHNIS